VCEKLTAMIKFYHF